MAKPKRYELTPEQWQRLALLLPGKPGDPGPSGSDNLTFVNGVLWVLRSGAYWHDLPERYGKWKTAHKRLTRCAKAGVWERDFADLIVILTTSTSVSTRASCELTNRRPPARAAAKKGEPGSGALSRRTDD